MDSLKAARRRQLEQLVALEHNRANSFWLLSGWGRSRVCRRRRRRRRGAAPQGPPAKILCAATHSGGPAAASIARWQEAFVIVVTALGRHDCSLE
jgi:hypothetical protein